MAGSPETARGRRGVALASWLFGCLLMAFAVTLDAAPYSGAKPAAQRAMPLVVPDPGNAPPGANLPFYEARKGDLTIYVLGTLHVGKPDDYPFRKVVVDALRVSRTVAFELSPDDLTMSQDDVQKYGMCSRACLPRMIPAPLWQKLHQRLKGNPAMLSEIRHMRPWLAALLVETLDSMSAELQTEYGTENQLENIYRGRIVGLESLAEQMDAFTGLSAAQQNELLAQELAQTPARSTSQLRELHRLWRAGDADMIYDFSQSKAEQVRQRPALADAIDERIVYARNRRFMARMLFLADPGKPVFVAIGALHLGGPRGVLQLLREHGFSVAQR
ncbi:hypothetical protein GCM10027419_42930 [Pandoraea terrae]